MHDQRRRASTCSSVPLVCTFVSCNIDEIDREGTRHEPNSGDKDHDKKNKHDPKHVQLGGRHDLFEWEMPNLIPHQSRQKTKHGEKTKCSRQIRESLLQYDAKKDQFCKGREGKQSRNVAKRTMEEKNDDRT